MKIDTQNFRPCVSFKLTLTTFLGKVLFVLKFLGQNGLKMCPKMVYASKPSSIFMKLQQLEVE